MQSWPLDPSLLFLVQANILVCQIAIIEAIAYAVGYMPSGTCRWVHDYMATA